MRPVMRRYEPTDLDAARRMVSRAERRALARAEQLCTEAQELLEAAADPRGPDPGPGPDPEAQDTAAAMRALVAVAKEAEEVLAAAVGRLESDLHAARLAREEAQRDRDAAAAARREAEEALGRAESAESGARRVRDEAHDQLARLRRDLAGLQDAMGVAAAALGRFVEPEAPARPAVPAVPAEPGDAPMGAFPGRFR